MITMTFRGAGEAIRNYIVRSGDQAGCSVLGWYGNNNVDLDYEMSLGDIVDLNGGNAN